MYMSILMMMMTSTIISIMTILLNLISKKSLIDREKSSPFECGFDPKSSPRLPFSLHFFLIAMIFLIFDIEIALMFPLTISIKSSNMMIYSYSMSMLLLILIIGLIHEWNQGSLNWKS